jgi:hypothetical protein
VSGAVKGCFVDAPDSRFSLKLIFLGKNKFQT